MARAAGYNWATLEWDDFGNAARYDGFYAACKAEGLRAGPWFTIGANVLNTPTNADFTIAEVEGGSDRDGLRANMHTIPAGMPKAIITDFNGFVNSDGTFRPDLAKPFVDAGFHCITECYLPDSPNKAPDRMEFSARTQLGFKHVQPCFGVYNGGPKSSKPGQPFTLADYAQWTNMPAWSIWLAEYVL